MTEQEILAALKILASKGWDASSATIYTDAKATGETSISSACFYPSSTHYLEDMRAEYLYAVCGDAITWATKFKSVKEHRLMKLLEAINAAKDLSKDCGLSADFINPLTAIAEQLASNAIEDKRE